MRQLAERLRQDPDWADATFLAWDSGIRPLSRRTFSDAANSLALHSTAPPLPGRPWGAAVSRIVLFAAPNRSFRDENLLWLWRLLLRIVRPLGFSLLDIRAGSRFVSDLRIQWIRTMARLEAEHRAPYVVQLLGDRDSLVGTVDSLDVEQMRNAVQLGVPNADHSSIVNVEGPDGEARYTQLRKALFGAPQLAPPNAALSQAEAERPVVFLLHGIRAGTDDWVARAKALLDARPERPVARFPSYGYFSAWNFAVPFTRATNLRFMLDAYTQELAARPDAEFHFVGHSNGTYILGQTLQAVPAVRFTNVFLAGSVLPPTYPWRQRSTEQVARVRNDQATRDIPVAMLCNLLRGLGMKDIGTGEFTGFLESFDAMQVVKYHKGGHAAALSDGNLAGVVEFALTGTAATTPELVPESGKGFAFVSRLCKYLPLILALAAVALAAWLGWTGSISEWLRIPATVAAGLATAYGLIKSV